MLFFARIVPYDIQLMSSRHFMIIVVFGLYIGNIMMPIYVYLLLSNYYQITIKLDYPVLNTERISQQMHLHILSAYRQY